MAPRLFVVSWSLVFIVVECGKVGLPLVVGQENKIFSGPEALSVAVGRIQPDGDEYVKILNPPAVLTQSHKLLLEYRCNADDRAVGVLITARTGQDASLQLFKSTWRCQYGAKRWKSVFLSLPDRVVFRPDFLLKDSIIVHNVKLKAWMVSRNQWMELYSENHRLEEVSQTRVVYNIESLLPYSRPWKPYNLSLGWDLVIFQIYRASSFFLCAIEPEIIELVTFPIAYPGSFHGITRQLEEIKDTSLQRLIKSQAYSPKFTFSTMIYLLENCHIPLCSIIQSKSAQANHYNTPLLFLTNEGKIHLQVELVSGFPSSLSPIFTLPLRQWIRIVYIQNGELWNITVNYGSNFTQELLTDYFFVGAVRDFNNSETLFHLGGSTTCPSFHGYMGETTLWRGRIRLPKEIPFPPSSHPMFSLHIDEYHTKCDSLQVSIKEEISAIKNAIEAKLKKITSPSPLAALTGWAQPHNTPKPLCHDTSSQSNGFGDLQKVLWSLASKTPHYLDQYSFIGSTLYHQALLTIEHDLKRVSSVIALLETASCLGFHSASYLLSVLYRNGITMTSDRNKALLYALVGAQGGDQMSCIAMGNKHSHGLDGVPTDFDYSFAYYKYVAELAIQDKNNHDPNSFYLDQVRLTEEVALEQQTGESGDFFQWLKLQAHRGVPEAQGELARLLYWGQHGIERNVAEAMNYYRMAAENNPHDPAARYDYGLLLAKGQGTEQNVTEGLRNLNKSAELGYAPAYNALGWHAANFEQDTAKAVGYWEQAHALGNKEATHNLAQVHLSGTYPGQDQPDENQAYQYFYEAASMGHLDSGVVLSEGYNQGLGTLPRNSLMASVWARFIGEGNSDMTQHLRQAVNAYLAKEWHKTYLYYLLAADAGPEIARFNMAYLCEENFGRIVTDYFEDDCTWYNYNLSTELEHSHPYALNKMGDYFWYGYGEERNLFKAMEMYSRAAKAGNQQGLFNLAILVQEGVVVPSLLLTSLGVNVTYQTENRHYVAVEIYRKCLEDSDGLETSLPCFLALTHSIILCAWNEYQVAVKFASTVGVAIMTLVLVVISFRRQ